MSGTNTAKPTRIWGGLSYQDWSARTTDTGPLGWSGAQPSRHNSPTLAADSLSFVHGTDTATLSICLSGGGHVWLTLSPLQCAILSEDAARFCANQLRKSARS